MNLIITFKDCPFTNIIKYIYDIKIFHRFHTFNAARASETVPPGCNIPDEELYARPPIESRTPRGWLVDLINRYFIICDSDNIML